MVFARRRIEAIDGYHGDYALGYLDALREVLTWAEWHRKLGQ